MSAAGSERAERTPLRVLLVEDSEDDAVLVLRELRRGGYGVSHERVETAGEMLEALEERAWDVVISDHAMPGFSAPAALEMLREGRWPDIPFIIVSGHIGEGAAVEVMKAGAHDYVPKDNLARLTPVVERALRDAEERRQRRRAQRALREAEEKYRSIFENAVEGIFQTSLDGRFITVNPMMARIFGYESPEEMVESVHDIAGQHYADPEKRNDFTRRLCEEGQVFDIEFQVRRKSGEKLWVSANARVVRDAASGEVVGYEGTMEDITERKRAEEELRRSLERLVALHEAGSILGSTLEPEEIGARLLGIMRRISGFAAAAISMRDDATGRLAVWRSIGLDDLESEVRHAPAVLNARQAAVEGKATQVFVPPETWAREGACVGLCLPLRVRERVVGVLEVYGPEELADKGVVEILESLTSQAASALENARLYGELMQREKRLQELVGRILVAQEEERRRVSYDVHDGLAQVAAAAHQHLQAFAHYHPPDTEEGREDLEHVSGLVRQTVGEARRIIADLRPTALDDFGLKSAIRLYLDALRAEGWEISHRDGLDDERLPAATETAIFRVVQEALNNVAKHAGTRKVRVSLEKRAARRAARGAARPLAAPLASDGRSKIRLAIRDYGRGFGPESARGAAGPGERVGLTGMRERVTLLGGHFRVASSPGVGTLIVAEVPLLAGPAGAKAGDALKPPPTARKIPGRDSDGR